MLHAFAPKNYAPSEERYYLYQPNGTFVRGFKDIDEMQGYITSLEAEPDDYVFSNYELSPGRVSEIMANRFNETVMRMSCITMLLGRSKTPTEASMKKAGCISIYMDYCELDKPTLQVELKKLQIKLTKNFKNS